MLAPFASATVQQGFETASLAATLSGELVA
jgi:hypothetical protein